MGKSYYAFSLLIENVLKQSQINKIVITGGSAHLWTHYFNQNHPHYVIEESPHLIHWSLHYWMTTQVELL
jgi:hypothetical protein